VIEVVVVDDDPMVRSALRLILEGDPGVRVVGEGRDGLSGRDAVRGLAPDVAIMDLHMPGRDGIEATRDIAGLGRKTRVLVLTAFDADDDVLSAIEAGATGFLLKDSAPAQILDAVRAAARGEGRFSAPVLARLVDAAVSTRRHRRELPSSVTEREREVAELVAEGLSNAEIADGLCVSPATVKSHISALLAKTGTANRVQLAIAVLESAEETPGRSMGGSRGWARGAPD
jgi:DNA-binding NarL/FixJ family response regulator